MKCQVCSGEEVGTYPLSVKPRGPKSISGSSCALPPVEPRLGPVDDDVAKTPDGTVNIEVSFIWECHILAIVYSFVP